MLRSGKATFRDIARLVNRSKSHQLKSGTNRIRNVRLERLKKLGVRPLSGRLGLRSGNAVEDDEFYRQAFDALKKSGRSWATSGEIRSILGGDKKMTRSRSKDVIEIMRRAGVKGFKETDTLTSGDVYSERVLNVLDREESGKRRKARQDIIKGIMDKDERNTGANNNELAELNSESDVKQLRPVHLHTSLSSHQGNDGSTVRKKSAVGSITQLSRTSKKMVADTQIANAEKLKKNKNDSDEITEVPLAFDINEDI